MSEMNTVEGRQGVPEARYAYYRRCQVFRKGGEQCKAPAEKGSHICYAHAGQLATAVRRERELRAVMEAAVAQMRKRGKPECEMADLFMDFKGINVTLAVMAQAVIDGRIDCKAAGRLVVQLQTFSKLLWQIHRKGRKDRRENQISSQICADERGLGKPGKPNLTAEAQRHGERQKNLPLLNTDDTDLKKPTEEPSLTAESWRHGERLKNLPLLNTDNADAKITDAEHAAQEDARRNWAASQREEKGIGLVPKVLAVANRRDWAHAPPELLRAA